MRGRWLGRRRPSWIADAVLIPGFAVLAFLVDGGATRFVLGLIVVSRLLTAVVAVIGARARRVRPGTRDAPGRPS